MTGRVRALRQLCALLAGEDVGPETDWTAVAAVAQEHLLGGALWLAVRDAPPVEGMADDVARRLRWAHRRTSLDNARYHRQLLDAVRALNVVGIEPLALKGGAHLIEGLFPMGGRAMWDLDLLVPDDRLASAAAQLETIGYTKRVPRAKASAHELVFERDGDAGPLELHFELGDRAVTRALSTAEALASARLHVEAGTRLLLLAPTDALVHNVVHAEAQDLDHAVGSIPVRQLHTFVALARHHDGAVDWARLQERTGRFLRVHADLARYLFGYTTPGMSLDWRTRAHRLRCLATFAVPGAADLQRNVRLAFDNDYLRQRYGSGTATGLRAHHARTLLRERGRGVVRELLMPRAR